MQKRQSPQQLDENKGRETNKNLMILRGILKGNSRIFKVFYNVIMLSTSQMTQICNFIHISRMYHIYMYMYMYVCMGVYIVGKQNLPPQYFSLACGLFQVENNQGPKNSGRNFDLSPLTA